MVEREIIRERPVADREVVVEDRRRSGAGGLIGAIVAIALVLLVGWFLLNALGILGDAASDGSVVPELDVNADVNTGE